jgi:putative ABC transport system ATP-binding protein
MLGRLSSLQGWFMSVVKLLGVSKTYQDDAVSVAGLRDVTLEVRANRFTVISGPSGSGKTTLLNVIGCIDRPNSGGVVVAGQDVLKLSDDALSDFRLKNLGFIFQNFNLLPVLTVQENVEYPLTLAGVSPSARRSRVAYLLKAVGLSDRAHHRPGQLSGGQLLVRSWARPRSSSPTNRLPTSTARPARTSSN